MKNNKLKQKWSELPWYARETVWRCAAAVATLLFLMGMSEVAYDKRQKSETAKTEKSTQLIKQNPEKYEQMKKSYLMNCKEKQK